MDSMEEWHREVVRSSLELEKLSDLLKSRMPEVAEGTDSSGAVRVGIDSSMRLSQLSIEVNWQWQLPSGDLGEAITEAIRAAQAEQLRFLSAQEDEFEEPEVSEDEVDQAVIEAKEQTAPKADALPVDVMSLVEEVLSIDLDEITSPKEEGEKSSGPITVRVAGGQVSEVKIDPIWAKRQPSFVVASKVLEQCQKTSSENPSENEVGKKMDNLIPGLLAAMNQIGR